MRALLTSFSRMFDSPCIYLIDNGSLRADAIVALRGMAAALSRRTGMEVEPVSLLHSNKVPAKDLGGEPARIVRPTLRTAIEAGARTFVFLPLFLAPSRAITDYLPELIEEARELAPELLAVVAKPLAGADVNVPDLRLAQILASHVRQTMARQGLSKPKVALVDHGTPVEAVNRVRNAVALQLEDLLGEAVTGVIASSMERRQGAEYDFNEPLLEGLGRVEGFAGGDLIAAMFFLLPGRHAGKAGDIAMICDGLIRNGSYGRIEMTPLMTEHPGLLEILVDRLASALGCPGRWMGRDVFSS